MVWITLGSNTPCGCTGLAPSEICFLSVPTSPFAFLNRRIPAAPACQLSLWVRLKAASSSGRPAALVGAQYGCRASRTRDATGTSILRGFVWPCSAGTHHRCLGTFPRFSFTRHPSKEPADPKLPVPLASCGTEHLLCLFKHQTQMFGCLMSLKSYNTVVSAVESLMNQIGAAQLGNIRTAVNTQ